MNIEITQPINREEWLKLLHAKGTSDKRLHDDMDAAEQVLKEAARPRAVYKILKKEEFRADSLSLQKHLAGCSRVAAIAITLGAQIDELIRRLQINDMPAAFIADTGASVLIEQLADSYRENLRRRYPESYMTGRFSPGYGDWSIKEQSRMLRYLDAQKQIGLHLTSESLMVPRKSITAVIGISGKPVSGNLAGCEECVIKEKCELRKEGKFCGDKF